MKMKDPSIKIETLGGNCPVQADGTIDGKPFYFRARGDHWSIGIGNDPISDPEWHYEEEYGQWPDAGWMPHYEALAFISKAVKLYADSK